MTTAEILWMNVPLMVLFFGLWVGIPLWMVYKHPDRHPGETRTIPAYLRQRRAPDMPAQHRVPARAAAERRERELVRASRS